MLAGKGNLGRWMAIRERIRKPGIKAKPERACAARFHRGDRNVLTRAVDSPILTSAGSDNIDRLDESHCTKLSCTGYDGAVD
jgi:hypothetical protein